MGEGGQGMATSNGRSIRVHTKGLGMTKQLQCRDLGFECDAVVTANSEEEILAQVVQHGQAVHEIPLDRLQDPAFVSIVRQQIHDVDADRSV
jgi:predicted small metal-binding protein